MKKIFYLLLVLPVLCWAQAFEDVNSVHPNYTAIEWMKSENIVEGYKEGRIREFRPDQSVSRAEAIKMLLGVSEIPIATFVKEKPFPDVIQTEWFAPYVLTAVNTGVVKGFADGKFHPASQVTRAEMLAMTLRLFDVSLAEEEGGDWTTPFVEFAQKMHIIEEDDNTHQSLNRGEVAEILYRTKQISNSDFTEIFRYSGSGNVAQYLASLIGKKTASGELVDANSMTAAHRSLPFGTKVRVWRDNISVVVTINDRLTADASSVLVLSQKAFSLLAEKNQGVVDVSFEVFSSPSDLPPSVPEYVRPSLSDDRREQPSVPESITEKIAALRGQGEESTVVSVKPLFDKTVVMLAETFFENFTMRRPFPRTILKDTVLNFSGTTDEREHQKVTLFLQPITDSGEKTGDQLFFTGKISGKNFSFPARFDQVGEFLIGVVLDDDTKSRVETIEVLDIEREPVLPIRTPEPNVSFAVRVVPEEQRVIFDLSNRSTNDVLKIEFAQTNIRKKLFLESGIEELSLPYNWFLDFDTGEKLAIDIFSARSNDGTISQRTSGWAKGMYENYELVPGFLDVESEKVSVQDFPRWKRDLSAFSLRGKVLVPNVVLPEHAFVTPPSGRVQEIPYERNGDWFSFEISPNEWGAYAIEVIGDDGEVLFNRELYIAESLVLPVFPPERIVLTSNTVAGVRAWINAVRSRLNLKSLISSAELNGFAQNYAERMANEQFLSHTSPTGQTFESRIKAANLEGSEFGENLGMGSTLQLALDGLRSSGSHFKNISNRKWTVVGIGIAKDSLNGNWYVSQVFRR
jgi:rare lipoprotein A